MQIRSLWWTGKLSRSLAEGAGLAAIRFPVAALALVAATVLANLAIEDVYPIARADLPRFSLALFGAATASMVIALALESRKVRAAISLASSVIAGSAVAACVWTFGVLPGPIALVTALTFAALLSPFVGQGSDQNFWSFALWSVVGSVLAFVSVLVFISGLSAILEMVRFLLGIGFHPKNYEHIYATALTLVGPLFALGRVSRNFDEHVLFGTDDRLAGGVRIFLDWVAVPLALACAAVLHAYAVKILIFGVLPVNQIGWIVTSFTGCVLALRVAIDPFVLSGAGPTRFFGWAFATLLVVPLMLLAVAASLRIEAEGLTVERYYFALAGLVAALAAAAQAAHRLRRNVRLLYGLPLLALALSSFGPLGVATQVVQSQVGRLKSELGDRIAPDGTMRFSFGGAEDRIERVRSRLSAIVDAGGEAALLPLIAEPDRTRVEQAIARNPNGAFYDIARVLGVADRGPVTTSLMFSAAKPKVMDVAGYDLLAADVRVLQHLGALSSSDGASVPAAQFDGNVLVLVFHGKAVRFPLHDAFLQIDEERFHSDAQTVEPFDFDLRSGEDYRIRVRTTRLSLETTDRMPLSAVMTLLLRNSDWPLPR